MHDRIQTFIRSAPALQSWLEKTASRETVAKSLLHDADSNTATALYMATRMLYGLDILDWEPETFWLTLAKDGIDLAVEERNKLMAAVTLQKVPSFYWDNIVFQQTVQALNGALYDPEALQETPGAYMAWAVYEAGVIRGLDPEGTTIPEFDEDVQQFVAVCLQREGFVYPPEVLRFTEDNLDSLYQKKSNASRLKSTTKTAWAKLDKGKLERTEFAENSLGVQLALLAACQVYVSDRMEQLSTEIAPLR
jgi:hypothetical protein